MVNKLLLPLLALVAVLAVACTVETPQTELGLTGAALSVEIATSDVTGFRYDIMPVDCTTAAPAGKGMSFVVGLEDMYLPDGIPGFINNPFALGSKHAFGDFFVVLAEGCYDVTATPMAGDLPSQECAAATKKGVKVNDGLTTEIMLVCQCEGKPVGALDSIAVLNHPPILVDLTYDASKFLNVCEEVKVCATFSDDDGDPLKFVWKKDGAKLHGPWVVSHTREGNAVTECVVMVPYCIGDWNLYVAAFDMVNDNDAWVTVEAYLAEYFEPAMSHDDLVFPLHVGFMPHECPIDMVDVPPAFSGGDL